MMLLFQIRRQGRNFGAGEKVKLSSKPVTVKDPASLNPPTEAKKMTTTFDEEKAPVFNLKQMIEDEAEKLKNEVRVTLCYTSITVHLRCVSRIVAFIVENIDTKFIFACLVG